MVRRSRVLAGLAAALGMVLGLLVVMELRTRGQPPELSQEPPSVMGLDVRGLASSRVQSPAQTAAPTSPASTVAPRTTAVSLRTQPAPPRSTTSPPRAAPATLTARNAPLTVYLDWAFSDLDFDLPQFRVLETVLQHYPDAAVRLLVYGPMNAGTDDYFDVLPTNLLQKYAKRGYNCSAELWNSRTEPPLPLHMPLGEGREHKPGSRFWEFAKRHLGLMRANEIVNSATRFTVMSRQSRVASSILAQFLRLARLHDTGGLYLDFSTVLLRPLPAAARGFSFRTDCNMAGSPRPYVQGGSKPEPYALGLPRRLESGVMYFPQPRDPVLTCALDWFDSKVEGEVFTTPTKQNDSCFQMDLLDPTRNVDRMASAAEIQRCVVEVLDRCMAKTGGRGANTLPAAVDWLGCSAEAGRKAYSDAAAGAAGWQALLQRAEVALLWMGPQPRDGGAQLMPAPGSLVARVFDTVQLDRWLPEHKNPIKYPCVPLTDGSFPPSRYTRNLQFAGHRCAPVVFMPGIMKCGTTSLYNTLLNHPQVLSPHRGMLYKEPHFYAILKPNSFGSLLRVHHTPVIEADEPFVWIDASIYPFRATQVADQFAEDMLRDNPGARVILMVRDPVDRAWSYFRYLKHIYGTRQTDFNAVAEECMQALRKHCPPSLADVGQLRPLYTSATSPCVARGDPGIDLLRMSVYYPQVLLWLQHVPRERLLIIPAERMHHNLSLVMDKVYDFVGLARPQQLEPASQTWQSKAVISEAMAITRDTEAKLRAFFRPYNEHLYRLAGEDFGWERRSEASWISTKLAKAADAAAAEAGGGGQRGEH